MSFGAAVKSCFRKYGLFSGRARRSEFWCWILFFVLCSFTTSAIDASAGLLTEDGLGPVNMLATVALLVPTLAVTVRRLHDTGRSGWFYFLSLIPIVGTIALLVWTVSDSQGFTNAYGPVPKRTPPR